eukprot:4100-Heterococcus_DN1.PRE.2
MCVSLQSNCQGVVMMLLLTHSKRANADENRQSEAATSTSTQHYCTPNAVTIVHVTAMPGCLCGIAAHYHCYCHSCGY